MYNSIKGALLSSLFIASAYGTAIPQSHINFNYESKYATLKFPELKVKQPSTVATAQYAIFATNDLFKVRGSLEAQVSDNLHLNLNATVQVHNGQQEIVPNASLTYKVSEKADAKLVYNQNNAMREGSRMLRLFATLYF